MSAFFTTPLALLGLLTLPALVALYFLRRKPQQRIQVSSLFLWSSEVQVQQGGPRFERMQRTGLLLLELLLLLLLTFAAADLRFLKREFEPPLVVVLDDSYSMLAGGDKSPRALALQSLRKKIDAASPSYVRLVLAGPRPRLLGGTLTSTAKLADLLRSWKCRHSSANLSNAVGFAMQVGGRRARVLVVTDHAPERVGQAPSRVKRWAVGRARKNVAIVQAVRTQEPQGDGVLAIVANLSNEPVTVTFRLRVLTSPPVVRTERLSLAAGQERRLHFTLSRSKATFRLSLDKDSLPMDNGAVLLPVRRQNVRVQLKFRDETLRGVIQQALLATKAAVLVKKEPQLLLTDEPFPKISTTNTWRVRFLQEKPAFAYTGPWILQRTHPLLEGISLKGVIWGAGSGNALPGTPLLMAGRIPLLSVVREESQRDLYFRWRSDLSNLSRSPNWPIFFWNLVRWRASQRPGFSSPNGRLNMPARFTAPAQASHFVIEEPDGRKSRRIKTQREALLPARTTGVHHVYAAGRRYSYSVNALSREESDLRKSAAGMWGKWKRDKVSLQRTVSVRWMLLIAALLLLLLHQYLTQTAFGEKGSSA